MEKTDTKGSVYVVDTELPSTIERTGGDLGNVIGHSVSAWEDLNTRVKNVREQGSDHDWLVVDNAANPWDMVQSYFVEKVHNAPSDTVYLDWALSGGVGGGPIGGEFGKDWGVINKLYNAYMGQVQRFPGHVLMTTPAEVVKEPDRQGKGGDSAEIRQEYSRFGCKPKGQKALGHQVHTVLLLQNVGDSRKSDYRISTMKDRSREELAGEKFSDFVMGYLVKIAGWRMNG